MIGAEGASHQPGVRDLIGGLAEAEAERLDRSALRAPEHRHNGARVDAAGERDTDRHVRDELALNRFLIMRSDPLHPFVRAQAPVWCPVNGRVAGQPGLPAGELEHVAWRQAIDLPEEGAMTGDVADVHRQVQAHLVELGPDESAREHRLGLGPEGQHPVPDRVHQRFHPERVPDQEELATRPVEQRECEYPVEPGGEGDPLVLVQVRKDLSIAAGRQTVTAGEHHLPELGVVVDLTVVDDNDRAVFVGHRLRTTRHVLDRKPAVAEADVLAAVEALAVRSPVSDGIGHRPDKFFVPEAPRARYPAHRCYLSRPRVIGSSRRRSRSSRSSTR